MNYKPTSEAGKLLSAIVQAVEELGHRSSFLRVDIEKALRQVDASVTTDFETVESPVKG